jgi:sigma-B regulation protein RsbU (phosphoserine phosphatase)
LLGAFPDAEAFEGGVTLQRGDALVLYTDGVSEARRGDTFFGTERLIALLTELAGADAAAIVDGVIDAALEFQGNAPRDDIAVVAVRLP